MSAGHACQVTEELASQQMFESGQKHELQDSGNIDLIIPSATSAPVLFRKLSLLVWW